tara:strand:+ start:199 stop:423 length:225 start_codon:yes stop_codon:yes gene_type:complete
MGKMKSFYYDDPQDFALEIKDLEERLASEREYKKGADHVIKRQQAIIEDLREQIVVLECEIEDLVIAQAQKKYA